MLFPLGRLARPASPRTPRAGRHAATRRALAHRLLTAAAVVTAAATGVQAWAETAFAGRAAPRREAAAGSVSPTGPTAGRPGSTFARAGRIEDGVRDGASGMGRLDVVREDRRLSALSVRRQLERGAPGTYIGELLRRRDSSLTRWPDRPHRPLAVFVGSGAGLADWRPEYVRQVASAFVAWTRAGVPIGFQFVSDSARADVHVAWIDRFTIPISGRTVWSRDERWWMVDARVTLALHHSDGDPLDGDQMRALAMHEVGHLLGLDHTDDTTNVMAPRVRVRELSAADQATARLLYSVPAGRVR